MPVRARVLVLAAAALALGLAVAQGVTGPDALIAVPALLLLVPLAAGRYIGVECLARRARRPADTGRRRGRRPVRGGRRYLVAPRGGLLIAVALGRRGPPEAVLAR